MRLEIIANHSVEADIIEAFRPRGAGRCFTKIPSVHGTGHSDPKSGDAIWPEENFLLIVYCDEEEAVRIAEAVQEVKGRFEGEGIKLIAGPSTRIL